MSIATVDAFVEVLGRSRLLETAQHEEVRRQLKPRFKDPQELARELLKRAWLTPYQVNQVFQGNAAELVMGQYLILERLGEGGMGQVYKARHRPLSRIVALKLLRKKLLSDVGAAKRFHREILAAAQLNHPNIVLAYDADEIDGHHFYTMEFVEGTTLGHLVRRSGPLPVSLASEYVRQAASGLQHAYEHGLVHRDIKPSNLILTWTSISSVASASATAAEREHQLWGSHLPLIKIFDMGLVSGPVLQDSKDPSRPLTQKGTLMGTPDFIAPEQAMNPRLADTRSDLYSLGGTYYFMLTGQVPFPGGTPLEKVIHHQTDEPTPVEKLRPGLAPEVQAIVRKLMAKKPADRYQTPKELIDTLTVLLRQMELAQDVRRARSRRE